jgi:hypothetical protein
MAGENLVSISFASEELASFHQSIETLVNGLTPKLVSISSANRQELPKMGDKTVAFVTKAHQYTKEHSDLVPPYINPAEMEKDIVAVKELRAMLAPLQKLTTMIEDTAILAGSEAYSASLAFYGLLKNASKMNVPGTANAYQDLKERFPGSKSAIEQPKTAS